MGNLADKKEYGDKLIKDWMSLFSNYSIGNNEYALFTLHCIIGQVCKHVYFRVKARKIDSRIQFLLLQASGSGKGAGYGLSTDIMEALGLRTYKLTQATDPGLIGTQEYNPETKKVEIIDGIMKSADMICFEEASIIFDSTSEHSKNTPIYIRVSCNSIYDSSSKIEKKLGQGKLIKLSPHCSWFLLTYKPDKLMETVAKTGNLQRFITVIREVGLEERKEIINEIFNSINISTEANYLNQYISILERLKRIKAFYGSEPLQIEFTDDAKENLRETSMAMIDLVIDTSSDCRRKLEEFFPRLPEIITRIATHHALFRLSLQVEVEDTSYAKIVMFPIWKRFIAFLEIALIPDNIERTRISRWIAGTVDVYKQVCRSEKVGKILLKDNWIRQRTLVEKCLRFWDDISVTSGMEFMKSITKKENEKNPRAWFEVKKVGSVQYVRLLKDL